MHGDAISTIKNKKKIILGLAVLGILSVFLVGCAEQQNTASAETTPEDTQSEMPKEGQMPPQDGNFTPGERPDFPKDGNFAPPDRK